MLTDCSIQTEEPDEALDFNFTSADVVNKIIMKVYRSVTRPFCISNGPFLVPSYASDSMNCNYCILLSV